MRSAIEPYFRRAPPKNTRVPSSSRPTPSMPQTTAGVANGDSTPQGEQWNAVVVHKIETVSISSVRFRKSKNSHAILTVVFSTARSSGASKKSSDSRRMFVVILVLTGPTLVKTALCPRSTAWHGSMQPGGKVYQCRSCKCLIDGVPTFPSVKYCFTFPISRRDLRLFCGPAENHHNWKRLVQICEPHTICRAAKELLAGESLEVA